ncbi:hypothetical protein D3C80_598800 [compost metagenome]
MGYRQRADCAALVDDGKAQLVENAPRLGPQRGPLHQALARAEVIDADVLGHRQVWRQGELLVDHRYPQAQGIGRFGDARRLLVQQHLAGIAQVGASEDFHQGRFTRAVLAHQCVYLTGLGAETGTTQSADAAESLVDVAQLHSDSV